jgi:hypothetical protein
MSIQAFCCGTSAAVFSPCPAAVPCPEDREPARLYTRLHLATATVTPAGFCVVAVGPEGCETLVCLAHTRAEAVGRMGTERGRFDEIRLQRWVGSTVTGRWETLMRHTRRNAGAFGRRGRRRSTAGLAER